jgi:uncharacterized repeat protein (TIGR01451 family)
VSQTINTSGVLYFNNVTTGAHTVTEEPMLGWQLTNPGNGAVIVPTGTGCAVIDFVNQQVLPGSSSSSTSSSSSSAVCTQTILVGDKDGFGVGVPMGGTYLDLNTFVPAGDPDTMDRPLIASSWEPAVALNPYMTSAFASKPVSFNIPVSLPLDAVIQSATLSIATADIDDLLPPPNADVIDDRLTIDGTDVPGAFDTTSQYLSAMEGYAGVIDFTLSTSLTQSALADGTMTVLVDEPTRNGQMLTEADFNSAEAFAIDYGELTITYTAAQCTPSSSSSSSLPSSSSSSSESSSSSSFSSSSSIPSSSSSSSESSSSSTASSTPYVPPPTPTCTSCQPPQQSNGSYRHGKDMASIILAHYNPVTPIDIALEKVADRSEAQSDDVVTYSLTVTNPSKGTVKNVVVDDAFDARLLAVQDAGNGTVFGNHISWNLAQLDAGESLVLRYRMRVLQTVQHGDILHNTTIARADDVPDRFALCDITVIKQLPQTGILTASNSNHLTPMSNGEVPVAVSFAMVLMGLTAGAAVMRKVLL